MARKPQPGSGRQLWSGRFGEPVDERVKRFSASVDFDRRLARHDIAGSLAHARMLAAAGIIAKRDLTAIERGPARIRREIGEGRFEWSLDAEDVHLNIERRLTALVGEAGKRLHTARSRNDQVATDLRLWLREEIDAIDELLAALLRALIDQAERHAALVMPGFTHLQVAQPVTFGHHLLAYVAMLERDRARLAEELVLWSNPRFGFVRLPENYSTGSSIMPQKKNPDVPELVRGKSARVIGSLVALLTLMKAQPLAYNKDNQEDKEPLFDAVDTLKDCLAVFAGLVAGLAPVPRAMRAALTEGHASATDLADYLVRKGVPFRDAHEVVARAVNEAERRGTDLARLPLAALKRFSPHIGADVRRALSPEGSVATRNHIGGTAPAQVRRAAARARKRLAAG